MLPNGSKRVGHENNRGLVVHDRSPTGIMPYIALVKFTKPGFRWNL